MIQDRIKMLETALGVAMQKLAPDMPGDSRAVPDWFVACAAVLADISDEDGKIEQCLNENLMLEIPPNVEDAICKFTLE